jgi:glutathione S-transferase
VPVLELDDGTLLSEVVAICQYLEELQPEPLLFGSMPVERALVTMWNTKIEQQGFMAIAEAFRNSTKGLRQHALPGPDSFKQIPELADRGRKRVQLFFEKLDSHLSDKAHIVGENFSIADISAFVVVDFVGWIKVAIPNDAINLARWYASVSARASAAA